VIALRALIRTHITPGIDWRVITPTGDAAGYGIVSRIIYAFGHFYALTTHEVSTGGTNPAANMYLRVLKSTNGVAWTTVGDILSGQRGTTTQGVQYQISFDARDAVVSEGMACFVGLKNQTSGPGANNFQCYNISSTDGITWNASLAVPTFVRRTAYGNNAWMVSNFNNELYRSVDFETYTQIRTNSFSHAFGNDTFVEANSILGASYSTDGLAWTPNPFFNGIGTPAFDFAGNKFWAIVSGSPLRVFYSADGVYWNESIIPVLNTESIQAPGFNRVGHSNGTYIINGYYYPIAYGDPVEFTFYSKGGSRFIDITQSAKVASWGLPGDAPFFVNSLGFGTTYSFPYTSLNKLGISP
jgi:hypothetical protein